MKNPWSLTTKDNFISSYHRIHPGFN
jgi:hypothetical protein